MNEKSSVAYENNIFDLPNAQTIQALRDVENSVNLSKGFDSLEELWEALNADD